MVQSLKSGISVLLSAVAIEVNQPPHGPTSIVPPTFQTFQNQVPKIECSMFYHPADSWPLDSYVVFQNPIALLLYLYDVLHGLA